MSWEGHLLRKPVGWGDVSTATGVGGPPYDLGGMIANASLIKKWSLHKPVRLQPNYDTPADISEYTTWISYMQNKVAKADGTGSAPYGLFVTPSSNLYDIIGTNSAPLVDWVYQQPPATDSFWRRALDFADYTDAPNVPLYNPGTFTFYKAQGVTNILEIDTNDGEAGNTSIEVKALTQLNDYQLLLFVKNTYASPTQWLWTVMSGSIMDAVDPQTNKIAFTLPSNTTINSNTTSGFDAYLVGVTKSAGITPGQWNTITDEANIRNFYYSMIPLPFANKTDCNFKFKVTDNPSDSIVHYTYNIYLNQSRVLKYIEFEVWIYRNVSPPTTFSVTFNNMQIYPDYDYQHTTNFPLTGESFVFGGTSGEAFSYASGRSYASLKKDMSRFNYTLDDLPELVFQKQNSSNYGWDDGGNSYQVIIID